ncbi:MAG TPA: FHA domain-containing protein [Acidimicrobiia bacterium]
MSDAALGILKGCLLALVYLFLLRVVLLVASELRGTPGLGRAAVPASNAPPAVAMAKPAKARRGAARRDPAAGWRLVVTEPAATRGATFAVDGELTIGRGGGCTVTLPGDTYASTVHARAYHAGADLWIEDLDSTNGTFVNGTRVESPVHLQRGDKVRVGSTVLEVAQ